MFLATTSIFRTSVLLVLFSLVVGISGGCTRSYVDPTYQKIEYEDLLRRQQPQPVKLQVEFQRNGAPAENASQYVFNKVERFFNATGFFKYEESGPELTIVLNNVGDLGSAAAKGFGTGLTFGLIGNMVTDGYILTASYIPGNGLDPFTKQYEHAIHSTLGNKAGPAGLQPMPVQEAFDTILEDMLLSFISDMQNAGYL